MKLARSLLFLGVLFSIITVAAVATMMDLGGIEFKNLVLFFSFLVAPLALTVLVGELFRKSRPALITCIVALVAAFGFMVFLCVDAFYIHTDTEEGLVLILGAIGTLYGLLPFGILALVFFLRGRRQVSANQSLN